MMIMIISNCPRPLYFFASFFSWPTIIISKTKEITFISFFAAHLNSENVNVLAVDWSRASFLYSVGLANAPQAAEMIADIINFLQDTFGYNPSLIRIVGVGLGGHIAGLVARHVRGDITHIVGKFHLWNLKEILVVTQFNRHTFVKQFSPKIFYLYE